MNQLPEKLSKHSNLSEIRRWANLAKGKCVKALNEMLLEELL